MLRRRQRELDDHYSVLSQRPMRKRSHQRDVASDVLAGFLPSLASLSDGQLIAARVLIEAEMHRRGVAFSVGDVGEALAIEYFNTTPGLPTLLAAPPGTKNVDAISRDGERYSIKTLLKAKKTGTVYPDALHPDRQLFEYLLVVHLSSDYTLRSIHRYGWEVFTQIRSWDKRMNAWYLSSSQRALGRGEMIAPMTTK